MAGDTDKTGSLVRHLSAPILIFLRSETLKGVVHLQHTGTYLRYHRSPSRFMLRLKSAYVGPDHRRPRPHYCRLPPLRESHRQNLDLV